MKHFYGIIKKKISHHTDAMYMRLQPITDAHSTMIRVMGMKYFTQNFLFETS